MPFAKCPNCARIFSIQVPDIDAWLKVHWPGYKATELVPETCPECKSDDHGRELADETDGPP